MSNTPRIEGTPDPRQLGKLGQKEEINTEEFKKILRVDKSDESEQKNKRNLSKSEEGEEEEVEDSKEPNTPQTLFSELMKEQQKGSTVFDVKKGKKQQLTANSDTKIAPDTSSRTRDSSLPPYHMIAQESAAPSKKAPPLEKDASIEIQKSPPSKKASPPNIQTHLEPSLGEEKKSKTPFAKQSTQENTPTTPISKKETSIKTEESLNDLKDSPHAPLSLDLIQGEKQEELSLPLQTSTKPSKEAEETSSAFVEIPKILQSDPLSSRDSLSSIEKERKTTLEDSNEGDKDAESHTKKHKESTIETVQISPDTPPPMMPSSPTPISVPSYATLSSQVFDLFEQLVGLITIEQSNKGVSTTTIKLSMPGSVFHHCEIKLEHYDTAPHSFNIQLLGTPEAVQTFSSNLSRLVSSFQQEKYSFSVNIQSPSLLKEEQPLFKRKEGVENEMGDSSQKNS